MHCRKRNDLLRLETLTGNETRGPVEPPFSLTIYLRIPRRVAAVMIIEGYINVFSLHIEM